MAVSIYLSQPIYISKYISSCIYFQVTLDAVGCPSCPDVGSDRFLMLLFFFPCLSVPPIHILDAVGFPGCSASSSYNNSGSPTPFYTTPSMAQVQQKMRQAAGSFQPAIGPAPDDAPRASRGSGRGRGRGRGRGKKEKDSEDEGKDGERHGKEPTDGSDADLEEEDQISSFNKSCQKVKTQMVKGTRRHQSDPDLPVPPAQKERRFLPHRRLRAEERE